MPSMGANWYHLPAKRPDDPGRSRFGRHPRGWRGLFPRKVPVVSSLSGSRPDPRRIAAGQRARRKAAGKKKLPPHLLPGIARRRKDRFTMTRRFVLVGILIFFGLLFTTSLAVAISTVAAIGGTVEAYRRVNSGLPSPSYQSLVRGKQLWQML